MASVKNPFLRYKVIDNELRKRPFVKTKELKRIFENMGEKITLRTIQSDLEDMATDSRLEYYAPIQKDPKKKAYYYTDRNYSILKFSLHENEVSALNFYASCLNIYGSYGIFKDYATAIQKIVDGVGLRNKFGETISELIIQTDTVPTVSGSEHLETIIGAIEARSEIEFNYTKYGDEKAKRRVLYPYLLKEYKNRWYVIGYIKGKSEVTTFALDRMSDLITGAGIFTRLESFDHDKYFKHTFGITRPDQPVEEIILEFNAQQAPYIKSLPIHPTQESVEETEKYLRIKIRVIPCYELYEYILGKPPT